MALTREEPPLITLVAVHTNPVDPEEFDRYYAEVHIPLVRNLPGVVGIRYGKVFSSTLEENAPYLICNVDFPDQATFDAALVSPEMQACVDDLPFFVTGQLDLHHAYADDHL